MFAYSCPCCAERLFAPADQSGQQTVCPTCRGQLTIPEPAAVDTLLAAVNTPLPIALDEAATVPARTRGAGAERGSSQSAIDLEAAPTPAAHTARPGPHSRRPLADSDSGRVILNPTGLFAVDIAAELSAVLSMRMAPPPEPVSDRQLTLAAWLAGSAAAGLLWLVGVVTAPALFPFVALVGAVMVAFGWLWRAYLAGRGGHAVNGLVTLLPPVALVRLFIPTPTHGLRPLRFLLAGAVFLGLFVLGPAVRAVFEGEFGIHVQEIPLAGSTPATRFQKAMAGKRYPEALTDLRQLPRPDAVTESERAAVTGALVAATLVDRADLRAAAVTALAEWAPAEAEPAVRAGLSATDADERLAACKVADRVLGDAAATPLAACLADRNDRAEAKAALIRLGLAAEAAVLPLLHSDREPVVLAACEILDRVGGANSVGPLKALGETTKSRAVRQEASQAAEAVADRVRAGRR